jgi:hypothetical protein
MAMSKGCTIGLIVLAVIVIILIIGVILVYVNRDKIMEAGIGMMIEAAETEILKDVPDGYTPEQVKSIMAQLKEGVKSDLIDKDEAQELANEFQYIMSDKKIDKEEGAKLLGMIQDALDMEHMVPDDMPDSMQAIPDSI